MVGQTQSPWVRQPQFLSDPIANTRVNHSKKAKLNIMHVTEFLGLFFRTGKIFFGLTRFSCLSVRMTDNFSASFGKSVMMMFVLY